MINFRIISRILGTLLFLLALLLASAGVLGLCYGEHDYATFGIPTALSLAGGCLLKTAGRRAENRMSRRDSYLIVTLAWVLFSAIGMLPFLIGGYEDRVAAAFFETMSGLTTTGATVLDNIDSLPRSVLFWRSLTHWFGGMGIVFFTIAVLPAMGMGDLKLFSAESTGLKTEKLHPRIATTARWLWGVYMLLTVSCTAALYLGGMSLFDAVNHAFSTVATGGFSTHQAGLGFYGSPLLEYVETAFMFLASINFTLLYLLLIKGRLREVLRDSELRCFIFISFSAIAVTTGVLFFTEPYTFEESFRNAAFHVVSLQSTTGFVNTDMMQWVPLLWVVMMLLIAIGASSGSTTGGIKCVRVLAAWRVMVTEFRHILHPHAMTPVRINNAPVPSSVRRTIFAFFIAYAVLIIANTLLLVALGLPLLDATSISLTSFSNVGPSFGHVVGPLDSWSAVPDLALWSCSLLMLAGRLEIFSLLILFTPGFWREN